MDAPTRTCWYALTGAVRSTTFLSAFVGIFQVVYVLDDSYIWVSLGSFFYAAGVLVDLLSFTDD